PKRSPVQRILDVVRRQGVAGEEDVDVATLDEAAKVLAGAGVDDGRPGDEEVLLPGTTALVHPDRRLANGSPARTLTRHGAAHESKCWQRRSRTFERNDPNAPVAHDHGPTGDQLVDEHALGGVVRDDDRAIHLRVADGHPPAVPTDPG